MFERRLPTRFGQSALSAFSVVVLLILCAGWLSQPAMAVLVFEENWDSGVIDPAVWTQGTLEQGAPVRYNGLTCLDLPDSADDPAIAEDLSACSSGDFGWVSGSASFNVWDTWIRSVNGFPRGNNLIVEFTTIGARNRTGTGLPFPGNSALNGPFHNTNDGGTVITTDCEGAMCGTYGTMVWGDGAGAASGTGLGDDLNKDPNTSNTGRWWKQLEFDATITPAVLKTTSALRHRVHIGDTSGFFYQYRRMDEHVAPGDDDWTPMMDDNGTPGDPSDDMVLDTRDTMNGGTSSMLYLGFCANQGAIIVDDITVYTGGVFPPVELSSFVVE